MRNRGVLRIAGAALLVTAAGYFGYATPAHATEPAYSVTIEPGVTPRMQASEVVALLPARHQAKVLSVECMSKQTFLSRQTGPVVPVFDGKTVWVIRVKVKLVRPPIFSDTTTHIIDDATGAGLGTGTGFWPDPG